MDKGEDGCPGPTRGEFGGRGRKGERVGKGRKGMVEREEGALPVTKIYHCTTGEMSCVLQNGRGVSGEGVCPDASLAMQSVTSEQTATGHRTCTIRRSIVKKDGASCDVYGRPICYLTVSCLRMCSRALTLLFKSNVQQTTVM